MRLRLRICPLVFVAVAISGPLSSCDASAPDGAGGACASVASSCAPMNALVAMSDQSSSGIGAIALGGEVSGFFGVDLGRDPQLAVSNGRAFMIARDIDTIFELSPACGEPMCRWSTRRQGRSTNPQDVAAAPDGSLWVPRFSEASVAVIDRDGRESHTVALPDLDGDGNPNASAIRILGAKAYVALGLLEYQDAQHPFRSLRPSALAVIDVASYAVERTIALRARNPFNAIAEHRGRFFLTGAGNFDVADETDAGIERLDPAALDAERLLVSELELGGSPSAVAVTDGCAAAIVADPTLVNATSVVTFDPESGATVRTAKKGGALLGPSAGFDFWAIAWSEGRLLVGDRRRSERGYPIHVFERASGSAGSEGGAGGCDLVERANPVYVAQKPVALRSLP